MFSVQASPWRLALRLLAVLCLLACPRIGTAAGTWSVLSLPQQPGEVVSPSVVAVDAAGNLYVADGGNSGRIQRRDARGNWSVIAADGDALGQASSPSALAVDSTGSLYVADGVYPSYRLSRAFGDSRHGPSRLAGTDSPKVRESPITGSRSGAPRGTGP
jgi:sugar lactone lactonase YvrE